MDCEKYSKNFMKVTSIVVQANNQNRYSIFVDGKYAFSLSTDALLESKIVRGQELSEADLAKFKKMSEDDKSYGLALAYVTRRMRSQGEIEDYLRRKGYVAELAERILRKLQKLGFVDDEEFARCWVENRRSIKSASAKKLQLELRQKKISDDIIRRVLAEDETDERQLLRELIAKKRKQSRYQDDKKLIAFLARQGFSYDDIKAVL